MRNRVIAASACVLAFILACGGDAELTEQEYFIQLEGISGGDTAKFQPVMDGLNVEYESETEAIRVRREFFEADLRILREMREEVQSLVPPRRVLNAHSEYTGALAALEEAVASLTRQVAKAQSLSEIEELFSDPNLERATSRFDEACLALEGLARIRTIGIDLDCESPETV